VTNTFARFARTLPTPDPEDRSVSQPGAICAVGVLLADFSNTIVRLAVSNFIRVSQNSHGPVSARSGSGQKKQN
jgi:hypothetical protein